MAESSSSRTVILVTGASSGIGRRTVVELARRDGVHLVLAARRLDQLEETIALARADGRFGAGVTFEPIACDLVDREQLTQLGATVRSGHDQLHALVNNAGVGSDVAFEDLAALAESDRMIELNVRAPIALTHELLPLLIATPRSVVVNVSSVAGLVGTPGSPVYSATKWALTGFSEALRGRCAATGPRVVCVQPGPVPTPGWAHERLVASPILRRVLTCDADVIARRIGRAVDGRGGPAPVRPGIYAVIPTLRGLAPWAVRGLVRLGGSAR